MIMFIGCLITLIGSAIFVFFGAATCTLHLFFIVPCLIGLLIMRIGSKIIKER